MFSAAARQGNHALRANRGKPFRTYALRPYGTGRGEVWSHAEVLLFLAEKLV
jgi:hypothetical protein